MTMHLKPGSRLFSTACTTEVIVVKAPGSDVDLTIGGREPVLGDADRPTERAIEPGHDGGTLMGKRYVDEAGSIELLCTKAGEGSLVLSGVPLAVKDSKPLPASD